GIAKVWLNDLLAHVALDGIDKIRALAEPQRLGRVAGHARVVLRPRGRLLERGNEIAQPTAGARQTSHARMSPRGCCSEGGAVPGDVEASSSRSFALIAYGVVEPCVPRHSPFVLGDDRVRRMARWTRETFGQRDGPVEGLARFVKQPERGLVARDPGPIAHRLRNSALVLARRREGAKWLEPTAIVAHLEDQVWVWPRQELVP